MKTSHVVLLVIFGLFFIGGCMTSASYNGMVDSEESVESAWSQVENVYQRRTDLIPNLVEIVKGAANFEKGTLQAVIDARAKATSITIDAENINAESIKQFEEAQSQLKGSLSRLLVTMEAYPELKATKNFSEFQAQLEGTENRISVERRRFNDTAKGYNAQIRKFPRNILAKIFGFEKKEYFKSDDGAENAPDVNFSNDSETK